MHGGKEYFGSSPPNLCLCPQVRENFCTSTRRPPNFCPKTGHHKRFSMKHQDRSNERDQVCSLRFCNEDLFYFNFFFWSSPPNLRTKFVLKEDNVRFRAKYSSNCCCIPNTSRLGCVSFPQTFLSAPKYTTLTLDLLLPEMGTRYFKSSAATATCPEKQRRYRYPLLVFNSSALPLLYLKSSGATATRYFEQR